MLESNQNHATIKDTEVCPTLPASMGLGGGYIPMIVDMTYQNTVGTISPGAHPGSYNGQDAYNDMLVTDDERTIMHGNRTGKCRNNAGGVSNLDR